jgi:uncharacterized protein YndB with AHSA1/START domain
MVVTKVVDAPVARVWAVFTDLARRPSWLSEVESVEVLTPGALRESTTWRETRLGVEGDLVTEQLIVTAVEPERACVIALDPPGTSGGQLTYLFAPIDVGPHRGGTAVTAIPAGRMAGKTSGLAGRMLAFVVGTFAARTAEGALRDELDALAAACVARSDEERATGPDGDRPQAA